MNVGDGNRALAEAESKALGAAERALRDVTGTRPVDFVSIEPAEWPDASLGWPEPGKSYAQVMTDGFKIIARSAGKVFECHVAGDNARYRVIKGE